MTFLSNLWWTVKMKILMTKSQSQSKVDGMIHHSKKSKIMFTNKTKSILNRKMNKSSGHTPSFHNVRSGESPRNIEPKKHMFNAHMESSEEIKNTWSSQETTAWGRSETRHTPTFDGHFVGTYSRKLRTKQGLAKRGAIKWSACFRFSKCRKQGKVWKISWMQSN